MKKVYPEISDKDIQRTIEDMAGGKKLNNE